MYPGADNPGFGSFVKHQVDGLRAFGHKVDVLYIHGYRSKLNYLKAIFTIFKYTWKGCYDVVHAHYGLSAIPCLFRWRTSLVITFHGSDVLQGSTQPLISKLVCQFANAVIVVSDKMNSIIAGKVIPCGVDLEVFKPYNLNEARTRLGIAMSRKVILFPFDPRRKVKRYKMAEAVVDKLRRSGQDVELLVAFGIRNDEMPWYYSAANAMILCSISEGSPTSVKEALACNLPVVSTDVGDVKEIMKGIRGSFVCEDNVDVITQCLEQILAGEDRSIFESRSYMERYNMRKTVESILMVYESAIQKNTGMGQYS